MGNGDDSDWKIWGIRLGFGIIVLLIPITLGLAALSYTNLKSEFKSDVGSIKEMIVKHLESEMVLANKQEQSFNELCKRVGDQGMVLREHDTLLRLPWTQRKDFYLLPKSRGTIGSLHD